MNNQEFDERQMYIRGLAYEHTCFAFVLEIIAISVLKEFSVICFAPLAELYVLLCLPFFVLGAECIIKGAYDPINSRPGMMVFTLMPITSVLTILNQIKSKLSFMENGVITEDGGIRCIYITWLVLTVVYWVNIAIERKNERK